MEANPKLKNIIKYTYYRQELQWMLLKECPGVIQGIMPTFAVDADSS